MPCAGGPEAAVQQVRRGGQPELSEEGGRSRWQERRDNGADRGAAGLLYGDKAARRRLPRSGGAKPEEAAHRHRDYRPNDWRDD
jgi:hypothetical protein